MDTCDNCQPHETHLKDDRSLELVYLNVAYHVVPALPSCSNWQLQKDALPYNSRHGIASSRPIPQNDKSRTPERS
jgi:hypothetical protein